MLGRRVSLLANGARNATVIAWTAFVDLLASTQPEVGSSSELAT